MNNTKESAHEMLKLKEEVEQQAKLIDGLVVDLRREQDLVHILTSKLKMVHDIAEVLSGE